MMAIAEAVICIVLLLVNQVAVGSKHEERGFISMMCVSLSIVVADMM